MNWLAFILGLIVGIALGVLRRRRQLRSLRSDMVKIRKLSDGWRDLYHLCAKSRKQNGPSYPSGRPAAEIDGVPASEDAYHPRAP